MSAGQVKRVPGRFGDGRGIRDSVQALGNSVAVPQKRRTVYFDEPGYGPWSYTVKDWTHTTGTPRRVGKEILYVPNGMPDLMRQVIDAADEANRWSKPTVVRGTKIEPDYEFRDCLSVAVEGEHLAGFEYVLREIAGLWAKGYKKVVNRHMDTYGVERQIQLLRYKKGMHFKEHIDQIHDNPELVGRRLSLVAFHTENGRGGPLLFPRQGYAFFPDGRGFKCFDRNKEQFTEEEVERIDKSDQWRQILPASPGAVILFPSCPSVPHWKLKTTRGVNHSLVIWYH